MSMFSRFRNTLSLAVLLIPLFLLMQNPVAAAPAQPAPLQSPPRPAPEVFPPVLRVTGADKPVRLASLSVRTEIQGGFAESTLDMLFHNPNNRILEGELEFPLLPGQEISGLALDIDGELRRGVPVSKTRGQEVFEDVVRQNVDPALLESTRSNAYRLRVYPLPANGKRRVVVRVMQPLREEKGMLRYSLPLSFADKLEAVSVEAVVVSPSGKPEVKAGNLGLSLQQASTVFRGKAERRDFTPEGRLDITLPAAGSLADSLSVARWKDRLYFSAAASIAAPVRNRALPNLVTILWDASGSGAERDHAKEFALLDSYFRAFVSGEVRLIVLRDTVGTPQRFSVSNGDWTELKTALHDLVYDGATNLTDWAPSPDCREYLLFSDGIFNYRSGSGKEGFPVMAKEQRLFAVNTSLTADYPALRGLAVGGAVIDLPHESFASAEAKLLREGTRISIPGASLSGAGEATLDPGSAYLAASDGQEAACRLAGWVKRNGAKEISVRVVLPDGSSNDIAVPLPAWDSVPGIDGEDAPLQARLWGRYAVARLEADHRLNKMAIARLGEQFGIVSRETSLIVLETAEDYARHDVTPPAALKAQVDALRGNRVESGGEKRLSDDVLFAMWKEKVAWWETSFPRKSETKKPEEQFEARQRVRLAQDFELPGLARSATLPAPEALLEMSPGSGAEAPPGQQPQLKDEGQAQEGAAIGIRLKPWVPDAPYIARMWAAKDNELYAIYLDERPGYINSSAFFIDVADRFFERGMKDLGLRVLSNLAEMQLENRQILRMLAYRLMQAGEMSLALPVLEQVRELAPYEPQSLRDIALAQASLGNTQDAVDLLHETARRVWSGRFGEINTIALTEMNALVAGAGKAVKTDAINPRLIKNLASDLRVVLSWDTDNTDMDLLVTGPDGEAASFQNPLTKLGGRMSRDCTQGYGPEEFMLKKASPGVYRVEADYYGHSRQTIAGEVTMMVTVFSKFGTPGQKEERITLWLKKAKDRVLAAEFTVKE